MPCFALYGRVLTVEMRNEHGIHFEDAISVSLNEGFDHLIKWIVVAPFVTLTGD